MPADPNSSPPRGPSEALARNQALARAEAGVAPRPSPGGQAALGPVVVSQEAARGVADAVRGARAESTWATYVWAWSDWERWCRAHNACAMPAVPEAVAAYLVERGRPARSRRSRSYAR